MVVRCCSALGFTLLVAGLLPAAPPTLSRLAPGGAERGKPVEIVVTGANLTPQARLLLPFPASQKLLPDPKPNPAQLPAPAEEDRRRRGAKQRPVEA